MHEDNEGLTLSYGGWLGEQAMDFLLPDRCRVVMNWLSTFLLATLDQRLKDSVPEASER